MLAYLLVFTEKTGLHNLVGAIVDIFSYPLQCDKLSCADILDQSIS